MQTLENAKGKQSKFNVEDDHSNHEIMNEPTIILRQNPEFNFKKNDQTKPKCLFSLLLLLLWGKVAEMTCHIFVCRISVHVTFFLNLSVFEGIN